MQTKIKLSSDSSLLWKKEISSHASSHQPRKRFGQNFLTDQHYIQKIIQTVNPQSDDHVVEIGPGQGALTKLLAAHCDHLQLIEIDRDLIVRLQNELPNAVIIHQADVLKFDFTTLPKDLRIIGNLPYNISSPILFRLIEVIDQIKDIHVMLQKEVVDRMVAAPGNKIYGRLSVMLQYHFQMKKLFDVPPGAFFPAPKVVSSVVRLTPHFENRLHANDYARFGEIVAHGFNQRRKTLRNALSGLVTEEIFQRVRIDPNMRAEQLSVGDFLSLANANGL